MNKDSIKRDLAKILPEDTSDDLITHLASYIEVLMTDSEKKFRVIPKGSTHPEHDICEDCFELGKQERDKTTGLY